MEIFCVDGNIGAGKTTALRRLAEKGYDVLEEDVESWQPYLARFYADPRRWAFALQMQVLQSLVTGLRSVKSSRIFVERDPLSCSIFSRHSYETGLLTELEYELFNVYYSLLEPWKPTLRFYIETDADECLRRVRSRSRRGEAGIDLAYLKSLERAYETSMPSTVVRIRGDRSIDDIVREITLTVT